MLLRTDDSAATVLLSRPLRSHIEVGCIHASVPLAPLSSKPPTFMGTRSLVSTGTPVCTGHCPATEDGVASAEASRVRSGGVETRVPDLARAWERSHPAQGMAGSTQSGAFCLKAGAHWSQVRLSTDELQESGDRGARRRGSHPQPHFIGTPSVGRRT